MKYLVVVQLSSGAKNATIFDTLSDAKNHLKEIEAGVKYPTTTNWEDDETLSVNITQSDQAKAYIIRTDRAEYRLVRHARGEKDEERRFFVRRNAVKYVEDTYTDASDSGKLTGDWLGVEDGKYYLKLYAAILYPESGNKSVKKRFPSADSLSFIYDSLDVYIKDDEETRDSNSQKYVHNKKAIPFYKRFFSTKKKTENGKRKKYIPLIATVAVIIAAITAFTTDWQMISDEMKASKYDSTVSEDVKSLADDLRLTRKGRSIFFASQPKLLSSRSFNRTCGSDGSETFTAGCYYKDSDDDEHIEIYNVGTSTINENGVKFLFADYRRAVTLHEMLHAAWERLDSEKQSSVCSDLKTVANQISALKDETKLYKSDQLCTELFARVGSEYIQLISPNNSHAYVYSGVPTITLTSIGNTAALSLTKVYDVYFDTTDISWIAAYWHSRTNLESLEAKLTDLSNKLETSKKNAVALITAYYYWQTNRAYNAANDAIDNYNNILTTAKKYVSTCSKIYAQLDSEYSINIGDYLSL